MEAANSLAILALITLLASGALLAFVGWTAAARVDWNRHKPAWWLTRLAESKDPATRDAALVELTRRIPENTLGTEREQALIAKALDHQGRWDQPWVAGWGRLV